MKIVLMKREMNPMYLQAEYLKGKGVPFFFYKAVMANGNTFYHRQNPTKEVMQNSMLADFILLKDIGEKATRTDMMRNITSTVHIPLDRIRMDSSFIKHVEKHKLDDFEVRTLPEGIKNYVITKTNEREKVLY